MIAPDFDWELLLVNVMLLFVFATLNLPMFCSCSGKVFLSSLELYSVGVWVTHRIFRLCFKYQAGDMVFFVLASLNAIFF